MAIKVVNPPNPAIGWTPDDIRALLMEASPKGDRAVGKALLALLDRQTQDEQVRHETKHVNGVGFTAFDAPIMTDMAGFFRRTGFLTPKQLAFLRACPGKQKTPRICKYAGQLAEIANAKIETAIMNAEAYQ